MSAPVLGAGSVFVPQLVTALNLSVTVTAGRQDPSQLRSLLSAHVLSGAGLRPQPGGALWARPLTSHRPLLLTAPAPGPDQRRPALVQCAAVLGRLDLDKPSVDVLSISRLLTPPAADLLTELNSRPELSNFAAAVKVSETVQLRLCRN